MRKNLSSFLISGVIFTIFGVQSNVYAEDLGYRDARYCEVVVGHGLRASVYTSFKLNECPQNLWLSMDSKLIKRQKNATFVYLNGPRYFLIDDFKFENVVANGAIESFGDIKMRKVAEVRVTVSDILKGFRPYREHTVRRKTLWIFKSGRPIYELISPKHRVYVMQSYSNEVMHQDEKKLAVLGSKLHLPRGWRFKTGIIQKDVHLPTVNNSSIITQDDFKNTYQLAPRDYLTHIP